MFTYQYSRLSAPIIMLFEKQVQKLQFTNVPKRNHST